MHVPAERCHSQLRRLFDNGYEKEDRDTNILRMGFVAELLTRNGVATIGCPIPPPGDTQQGPRDDRRLRRNLGPPTVEEIAEHRDPKGCGSRRSPARSRASPGSRSLWAARERRARARHADGADRDAPEGTDEAEGPRLPGGRRDARRGPEGALGLIDLRVTDTGLVAEVGSSGSSGAVEVPSRRRFEGRRRARTVSIPCPAPLGHAAGGI